MVKYNKIKTLYGKISVRQSWFSLLFVFESCILLSLAVSPNKETTTISGLPEIIPDGINAILVCTVQRIKPAALDIYWIFDGMKSNGSLETIPLGDETFVQHNTLEVKYVQEHVLFKLKALADPRGHQTSAPPPGSVSFIFMHFFGKSGQIITWHPHLGGWRLPSRKSWIRH